MALSIVLFNTVAATGAAASKSTHSPAHGTTIAQAKPGKGTRRQGDKETRGQGDKGTRGQGDKVTR